MTRHPSVMEIIRFFEDDHLPEYLKEVTGPTKAYKDTILEAIEVDIPELTAGLRKLLEAKDCFVRAALVQEEQRKARTESA